MTAICGPSGTPAYNFRTILFGGGLQISIFVGFGTLWDTLGHFGTSRGSGKPFEGGMEGECTTAIFALSGTPVYNFIPFHLEAAFKYPFWSDLGHFGTLWDILGLHGGAGSRLKAEWNKSIR